MDGLLTPGVTNGLPARVFDLAGRIELGLVRDPDRVTNSHWQTNRQCHPAGPAEKTLSPP